MITDIDFGYFKSSLARGNPGHQLLGRECANKSGALLRQCPEFAGILQADTGDQIRDRNTVTRHYRAELMPGRIPANVAAFEYRDTRAKPRRLQRNRQPGEPGADDSNVHVQIERQPRTLRQIGVRSMVY